MSRRRRTEAERARAPSVEIYDGRQYAGAILELGRARYETFDSQARLIGCYPNERAAQDAVLAAWRASGGAR